MSDRVYKPSTAKLHTDFAEEYIYLPFEPLVLCVIRDYIAEYVHKEEDIKWLMGTLGSGCGISTNGWKLFVSSVETHVASSISLGAYSMWRGICSVADHRREKINRMMVVKDEELVEAVDI